MDIEEIVLKAQMQTDVANTLDHIQTSCNVDRKTAHLILQVSTESIFVTVTALIKEGADNGPFAMLLLAKARKVGAETALSLLQDETL